MDSDELTRRCAIHTGLAALLIKDPRFSEYKSVVEWKLTLENRASFPRNVCLNAFIKSHRRNKMRIRYKRDKVKVKLWRFLADRYKLQDSATLQYSDSEFFDKLVLMILKMFREDW